jgi:hypothetical protein
LTIGKSGILTGLPMHHVHVWRMVRRRAANTGLEGKIAVFIAQFPQGVVP